MIKRRASLLLGSSCLAALAALLLTGCNDTPSKESSEVDVPSPAAASPADGKMGPPAPPPAAPSSDGPPTPFKGNGKVVTTKSGLKYEDMTVGTGPSPKEGQTVKVQYVGTDVSGQVFDSSYKHGGAFSFTLGGRVIQGWNEGVASMKVGGRRKLIVPPGLAYDGQPGMPFDTTKPLTFDVELIGVE